MRANELAVLVASLTIRVDGLTKALDQLNSDHKSVGQLVLDFRREMEARAGAAETRLMLVERDLKDAVSRRDVWGGRAFTVALSLASAVIGALLNSYLKKP